MRMNKITRRKLIKFFFIVPFILCLFSSIGIKTYIDKQVVYKIPEATEYNIANIVDYKMSVITLRKGEAAQEHFLVETANNVDHLKGVGAALFKKEEHGYRQLFPLFFNDEINQEELYVPANYFQEDLIKFSPDGYILDQYTIHEKHRGKMVSYNFFYTTYENYVLIWHTRVDMISSYFIDDEKIMALVIIVFLINSVASFISLVAYYCLENRVKHFIERRKLD